MERKKKGDFYLWRPFDDNPKILLFVFDRSRCINQSQEKKMYQNKSPVLVLQ